MYACLGVFWILVHVAPFCSNSLQHKFFHQQSTLQKMEHPFSLTNLRSIDNEYFNPLWRYCPALHWISGRRVTQGALAMAITQRQAILKVKLLQILKCKKRWNMCRMISLPKYLDTDFEIPLWINKCQELLLERLDGIICEFHRFVAACGC